ncbi:MAG TPA: transketolase [Verrucomicrobiae bacterium]|nr:transketolase [Verrucomicrobiae bacterium]
MSQTLAHDLDQLSINTVRILSVDMSEKAHSGHPGLPLGAAPMAYTLWDRILRHNPANPRWANRDRFILSAGHGCELLYSLLHLTGYNISMDDLQNFRQWGSKTSGHPEYDPDLGIEATTGPLGQGIAMAVGVAVAEAHLAARFNRDGFPVVDHFTFVLAGDGDLMEGISSEASSLAGTLQLGKLIVLYDDNHVSLDATTDHVFTEDRAGRFRSFGWHVISLPDGNDLDAIEGAFQEAKAEKQRPSLIAVRTHIGYGSPLHDSPKVHGEPMGPENARATRKNLGWPELPPFSIPPEVLTHFRQAIPRGTALETEWNDMFGRYSEKYPDLSRQLKNMLDGVFPEKWDSGLPSFSPSEGSISTRDASGKAMNAIAAELPGFVGGSADLAGSNRTTLKGLGDLGFTDNQGRNIHFGVREHAMAAMVNGIAVHGGLIPFGGTFFTFSDYMRPSLRLAALMQAHSIFIFTHDSIGLGQDGPTHQPVEHLTSLRAMPGLTVFRPADANETAAAWRLAIGLRGPVALVLTRQAVPVLDPKQYSVSDGVAKGAYILLDHPDPDLVLVATGSEVQLALGAAQALAKSGTRVRVVSMPSWELFAKQPTEYRDSVLPIDIPTLAIEAGATLGWYKWVGRTGDVIGLDHFGASAPGEVVMEKLGFNVDNVVQRAQQLLQQETAPVSAVA